MSLIPVPDQVSKGPRFGAVVGAPLKPGATTEGSPSPPGGGAAGGEGLVVVGLLLCCCCVVCGGGMLPLVILPMCSVAGFRAF